MQSPRQHTAVRYARTETARTCDPLPLINVTDNLSAHALTPCVVIGHDTQAGGQNGDTHATQNTRDVGLTRINAAAWLAHALQLGNDWAAVATRTEIFELYGNGRR